jgi:hypothetical protein
MNGTESRISWLSVFIKRAGTAPISRDKFGPGLSEFISGDGNAFFDVQPSLDSEPDQP